VLPTTSIAINVPADAQSSTPGHPIARLLSRPLQAGALPLGVIRADESTAATALMAHGSSR